jgi:TetR/AcrR family transcriptional regulator, transcriptional repressor for nem operon
MRDLRLTHGGFYRHFESKEDLFAEAFEQSLKELWDRLTKAIERAALGGELKALIDAYLDVDHLNDVAGGCPVAALASEVARRPLGARRPFLRVLRAHIGGWSSTSQPKTRSGGAPRRFRSIRAWPAR